MPHDLVCTSCLLSFRQIWESSIAHFRLPLRTGVSQLLPGGGGRGDLYSARLSLPVYTQTFHGVQFEASLKYHTSRKAKTSGSCLATLSADVPSFQMAFVPRPQETRPGDHS